MFEKSYKILCVHILRVMVEAGGVLRENLDTLIWGFSYFTINVFSM